MEREDNSSESYTRKFNEVLGGNGGIRFVGSEIEGFLNPYRDHELKTIRVHRSRFGLLWQPH